MPAPPIPQMDPDTLASQIAEQYLQRLRVFAARRLRNREAAEDAAQETLRRVIEAVHQGRIREMQALAGYVFETARHVCLHTTRDNARERNAMSQFADLAASMIAAGADPLDTLIADERRNLARQALADLEPEDRHLIELSYGSTLTAEEIASRLGQTATNVRVRRHRILRRIALKLRVTQVSPGAPED